MPGAERLRHVGITHRHLEGDHRIRSGIEDRHHVGRIFRRAVKRTMGIDRWIAPIRRDEVVQILVRFRPLPPGDDHIALQSLRPLGFGLRQRALGDTVGPSGIVLDRDEVPTSHLVEHALTVLAGLDAAKPCFFRTPDLTDPGWEGAGGLLAQLMTANAADVLDLHEPGCPLELPGNVAASAELVLSWYLKH